MRRNVLPLICIAMCALAPMLGCATPEDKMIKHMEQIAKIVEGHKDDPDKAGESLIKYLEDNKAEIIESTKGEFAKQIEDLTSEKSKLSEKIKESDAKINELNEKIKSGNVDEAVLDELKLEKDERVRIQKELTSTLK